MRPWSLPLFLSLMSLLAMSLGTRGEALLRYQREGVLDGQWWRLFSAHFLHLGWGHLALNLMGLWLVWLLVGRVLEAVEWWMSAALCALSVTVGLMWFDPQLHWYVGLSGLLHGLLVTGAVAGWRRGLHDGPLLVAAVAVKLLWEHFSGPMPGSEAWAGGHVVVDAHLFGALGGVLAAVVLPAWAVKRNVDEN